MLAVRLFVGSALTIFFGLACRGYNFDRRAFNKIDDKVLKLTEEKQSSFRGFTNQFTLEPSGNVTYDPESFLTAVKRKALAKIQTQTKVKIILRAKMEKTDLKTGESLVEEHQFRSKNEIVLESTKKKRIVESLDRTSP